MRDQQQTKDHGPRVISISSGKGGVGKTFFSVHLAARAANRGLKTLVLDSDFGLANVDVMLGLVATGSIYDVLHGTRSIDEVIVATRYGFDVIPGGSSLSELAHLSAAQQLLILENLNKLIADYDVVILDNAAGIGDNVLYFSSLTEEPVIVMTPEPTSLTDAYALIKVLHHQRHVKRFGIVVNKAPTSGALLAFKRIRSVVDNYLQAYCSFLGSVDYRPDIPQLVQKQTLLSEFVSAREAGDVDVFDKVLDQYDGAGARELLPYWRRELLCMDESS